MRQNWRDSVQKYKSFLIIAVVSLIFILLDVVTKRLVLANNIKHFKNYGVAFGFFPVGSIYLLIIGLFLLNWLIFTRYKVRNNRVSVLAIGMIVAGGIANIIDRLSFGYIVDYINIGSYLTFNLADLTVTSGVFILLIDLARNSRKQEG